MNRKPNIIFMILFAFLFVSKSYAGGIAIPGYRALEFSADKRVQSVRFHNPPENNCSFKLSLIMPDGAVLWTSDELLEPGNVFVKIMLSKPLKQGTYRDVLLKYQCYSLDGSTELNGAEIRLTLEVK